MNNLMASPSKREKRIKCVALLITAFLVALI